jgi:quinoprotein glucose dehydrogenase
MPKPAPGAETWEEGSNLYTGQAGAWSMMSADPELGYVYIPLETPTNEFYGGQRPGDGLFGESIVCLDAKTGKLVWYYQIVHHGLWDYDMPAAPILHDIKQGRQNDQGRDGADQAGPHLRVRPRDRQARLADRGAQVPAQHSRRARSHRHSPSPHKPGPMLRLGYSENDLIDFTPALREEGKKRWRNTPRATLYTRRPMVTPTNKGTWLYPGTGGGPNWNGAAFDPDTHMLYTPCALKPQFAGLRKGDPATTNMHYLRRRRRRADQRPAGPADYEAALL